MKRATLFAAMIATAWAQTSSMRPRPDANDYPANGHVPGATIAAVALSPAQVKTAFGSDTYKGYIVLEVAVYPDPNERVLLSPKDFMLKIGEVGELLRPSAPATIALSIEEKNNPTRSQDISRPVDVTTRTTIGYDSAGTYNPNTGKRQGAVYAGSEVDVAPAGRNTPSRPRANRGPRFDDMEAELNARALPEETASRPVAGYLYFIPPHKKANEKKANGNYNLDYSSDIGRLKLALPPPAK
jgi:hypothetical protein